MVLKSKYSALRRINIDALYNTFLGMTPREQIIAIVGIAVVLLIIIILPISLASSKISRMNNLLEKSQEQMSDIVHEIDGFNNAKAKLDALEGGLKKGGDMPLSTTIENIADKVGVKDSIQSQKERPGINSELFDESIMEVRLLKVPLDKLVELFYNVESDKDRVLRISKMDIKPRHDNRQLFDAVFEVSTFKLAGEE